MYYILEVEPISCQAGHTEMYKTTVAETTHFPPHIYSPLL